MALGGLLGYGKILQIIMKRMKPVWKIITRMWFVRNVSCLFIVVVIL